MLRSNDLAVDTSRMASPRGGAAGDDPFANVNIDESWAASAPVREQSAVERDWAAKRARWAAADRRAAASRWTAQREAVRGRRRARWRRVWPWLALVAVAIGLFALQRVTGRQAEPGIPLAEGRPGGMPPAGLGEQPQRILSAVSASGSSHDYVIAKMNPDGSPVTFSPCRTWPVVVNVADAPADGYTAVTDAVQEVSRATGLQLVVEGITSEEAAGDRAAFQPDRYGDRWAPILVDWTTGGAERGFAGHGGPAAVTLPDADQAFYVTGQITVDAAGRFNRDPAALRAILLHEFGHVVGLKHAASEAELMAATNTGQTGFGPGDLAGLAQLGQG